MKHQDETLDALYNKRDPFWITEETEDADSFFLLNIEEEDDDWLTDNTEDGDLEHLIKEEDQPLIKVTFPEFRKPLKKSKNPAKLNAKNNLIKYTVNQQIVRDQLNLD